MFDEPTLYHIEKATPPPLPPMPPAPQAVPRPIAAPPAVEKRWRFRDVLLIFIGIFAAIILGYVAMVAVGNAFLNPNDQANLEWVVQTNALTFVFITVGIITLFLGFVRGYQWRDFGFRRPSWGWVFLAIALGVVFIPIRIALIIFIALLFTPDSLFNNQDQGIFDDPAAFGTEFEPLWLLGLLQIGLLVVVLAPLVEELVFRGTLHTWLNQRINVIFAALITGTLFGVAHLDPLQAIANTVLGVVMGVCYHYSKSIWVPILIHFTNNFLIVAFVILMLVIVALAGG